MNYHHWTMPQLRYASQRWADGLSQDAIADALCDRFAIAVGKGSIASLARRNRDLFPRRKPLMDQEAA